MFNKYDAYKDSGVEWLGEAPNSWNVVKLKRVVKEHSGNGFPIELQGNEEGKIPFLKVSDISGELKSIQQSSNYVTEKVRKRNKWNLVPKNSLVTGKIGEALRKNHRKILLEDSIIDNNCIGIEAIKIDYSFNYYLHKIIDFEWFVNPGTIPSISVSKYKNFKICLPSINEQYAIVNFLDQKTSEIDQAIAIKEQQIALLNERKQIVIQKAVTQGLNPNVAMKDSGVEWIGQIPEHWKISRIKYLGKILNGFAFPSDSFTDQGVRVLKISNIQTMTLDWQDESYIDEKWKKIATNALVYKGDLVFALTRPIISTGLKATIIDSDETMLLNQRNAVLRPNNKVIKEWLYYVLLADGFVQEFEKKIDITGQQPNISTVSIGNLPLVYPTLDEQVQICETLERICQIIDEAINVEKKSIHQLKEYKTTLINDAVTGKIKVA